MSPERRDATAKLLIQRRNTMTSVREDQHYGLRGAGRAAHESFTAGRGSTMSPGNVSGATR